MKRGLVVRLWRSIAVAITLKVVERKDFVDPRSHVRGVLTRWGPHHIPARIPSEGSMTLLSLGGPEGIQGGRGGGVIW